MKIFGLFHRFPLPAILLVLLVCVAPVTRAVSSAAPLLPSYEKQITELLKGASIVTAPLRDLLDAVRKLVAANKKDAAAIVAEVLAAPRPNMWEISGEIVAAALEGLGPRATPAEVASVVGTAVQLQPQAVLPIVSSAAGVVPCDMIPTVVAAASPARSGKEIVELEDSKSVKPLADEMATDGKMIADGKTIADSKGVATVDLGQEIARAAAEARPDCNVDVLALAYDESLFKELDTVSPGDGSIRTPVVRPDPRTLSPDEPQSPSK